MALSKEKQLLIGGVVLALLGGLVYRQVQEDKKLGTVQASAQDLPAVSASDDVDKISITNGDKGEVVLEKKDDKWRLTKPVDAAANQDNVKSLVTNLKELKAKEVIAKESSDELKKNYELDASKAVHVQAWKGGEKKLDDLFGKYGGRGQMMMAGDKPGIYAASGYSSYLYTREPKNWRDQEIFRFDDANVNQVSLTNKAGAYTFNKSDKGWSGTLKGADLARFDEDRVKDLVRTFHALNADDFADGKPASETGLDTPEATVTFSLKDGTGKHTLKIGKTQTGTARFAKKDGSDTIFVIPSYVAEWAVAEPVKFQKSADGGAPKAGAGSAMPGMPPGMPPGMGLPPGHPDPHGH